MSAIADGNYFADLARLLQKVRREIAGLHSDMDTRLSAVEGTFDEILDAVQKAEAQVDALRASVDDHEARLAKAGL